MAFLTNNVEYFNWKSCVCEINTRRSAQLYRPAANLTSFQKGVCYASIKMFSALPIDIVKRVMNEKHFIANLRKFLLDKSLCKYEELFNLRM
jgi:hypothetical protein